MKPKVIIPTVLRQYAGGSASVQLEGASVKEVLSTLVDRHQGLKKHLYDDQGRLRSFINVYVNDEDVRYLKGLETAVKDSDVINIVPSVAGGSPSPAKGTEVELSKDEILRYSRHLIMPDVGMAGQKKLKAASVLIIGTGGLGSPLSLYLAAAGVGRIGLVDFDQIDFTNLQRQVLYHTSDVGRPKIQVAKERINAINPHVEVAVHEARLTSENALDILKAYDVIIDGTDNFPTRYLVNDACVLLKKPNVYGSIFQFEGQATVFDASRGPCYRCLYPAPPPPGLVPSCAEGGVLGILPGIIGVIQATETVKLIIGKGEPLIGRLVLYDALAMKFRELKLRKSPTCPICGPHPTVTQLIDYQEFCGLRGVEAASAIQDGQWEITVPELKRLMDRGEVRLIDVREPHEWEICRIEGAELVPLSRFAEEIHKLDSSQSLVLHCHFGQRSMKALQFLRQAGFTKLKSLKGGIDAWSTEIDPTVPRY